jgi:uncharacterized protein YndB with AHSA1/START domain
MTTDPSATHDLVLTRVLDAPRSLVYKAWTDPKHLARWWGPHGFTNPVCEVDLRPGGVLLIHMEGFGMTHEMHGTYVEVVEPERIAFTSNVADESSGSYLEILNTVTFAEHGGKTTLTLTAHVVTSRGPSAVDWLGGMEEGWSQSLDRLTDLVAKMA